MRYSVAAELNSLTVSAAELASVVVRFHLES
jgi:hypothetical protein